jgi:hypothetical protein
VGSEGLRDELVRAIHERGASRRFKEIVRLHGIESEWFTFRANALARIARDWCNEHGIVYESAPAQGVPFAGSARACVSPDELKHCSTLGNRRSPSAKINASRLLIIRLLQQTPIGSVVGCPDRHSRRRSGNSNLTSPLKRRASGTWQVVGGRMALSVLDAGTVERMNF